MIQSHSWLHTLESCTSTNTWALERLAMLNHGDVVFTRHQTAGRGQHDRRWLSPPGVLTASFVLELPIAHLSGLSLAAGLAVIDAIDAFLPADQLRLKWTNDVLFEDRKLAGILCEAKTLSLSTAQVVVGIGLNRCAVPLTEAISLNQISEQVPDERSLLEQLRYCLLHISDRLSNGGLIELLPQICDRDALLNRAIVLQLDTERVAGFGAGIDDQGRLLVRSGSEIRAFASGRAILDLQNNRV